jgi:hypothetical protein
VSLHILKKKKQKGYPMTRCVALALSLAFAGTSALAHPGLHVHPHDGAHWLTLISALGLMALAGGVAVARARSRK